MTGQATQPEASSAAAGIVALLNSPEELDGAYTVSSSADQSHVQYDSSSNESSKSVMLCKSMSYK